MTRHFAIVTQVYPPDPAAVGQHLADVAEELARLGHRVSVFTANRGYDDPSQHYPRFERQGNITVLRLPLASFGKGSISKRLLGGAILVAQAAALTALDIRLTDLLLSTTPHLVGGLGIALKLLRSTRFHYWLMDLNPDQVVAFGKLSSESVAVRALDLLNRGILRHATTVTTLDEAMASRFLAKGLGQRSIRVQSPWPIQNHVESVDGAANPFRKRYALNHERIIMHAGNHSAVHPLDTLIDAIRRRRTSNLKFFFVGGGVGKAGVEQWVTRENPPNVVLLPYQPRVDVPAMLCAADIHVVSVGNNTVGIVHPSKIYGALAAGRPILVLGPRDSPAGRLVREHMVGWQVEHGDIEGLAEVLDVAEHMPTVELRGLKHRALELASIRFARQRNIEEFCSGILEVH